MTQETQTDNTGSGDNAPEYPPLNLSIPQFTVRAILTGMVLGAVLSLCNIYAGLKIGWGFNMSITAALLSYGFYQVAAQMTGSRPWNILENNINQTAASSAASISSAGLVAPIPALTMLTGVTLSWHVLALWTFSVSLVGVVVAVGLRHQSLRVDNLPFPNGIATAATIKQMYARGDEAMARVKMLLAGGLVASIGKLIVKFMHIRPWGFPGKVPVAAGGAFKASGFTALSWKNMTFALNPGLIFPAVGAIIGFRACVSIFFGAVVAWVFVVPYALNAGMIAGPTASVDPWGLVHVPRTGGSWFGPMIKWLLWPGVAMMVTAALTSFSFSWRSILNALKGGSGQKSEVVETAEEQSHNVPKKWYIGALVFALILSVICQFLMFGISIGIAMFGVLLTFVLAIVAARVSGETGVTPVGPMGKVTQLTFGAIAPGNVTANLMAANVTGGAASQCADLLHDMKTGLLIGASPRFQAMAQFFGVMAGALAGSAAYLILIPDPKGMLLTEEWAAPAVAQWKAVAEVFQKGLSKIPPGAVTAMLIAGIVGIVLAILERKAPEKLRSFVPSPAGVGLAFVIPASYSFSFFLGGVIGLAATKFAPKWSDKFLIVLASGIIAGESLTGMILAFIG